MAINIPCLAEREPSRLIANCEIQHASYFQMSSFPSNDEKASHQGSHQLVTNEMRTSSKCLASKATIHSSGNESQSIATMAFPAWTTNERPSANQLPMSIHYSSRVQRCPNFTSSTYLATWGLEGGDMFIPTTAKVFVMKRKEI